MKKPKPPRETASRKRKPERKPNRFSAGAAKPEEDRRKPRFSRNLSVLYEDDALIVIDKPSGLLAVPIPGSKLPLPGRSLPNDSKEKTKSPDRPSHRSLLFRRSPLRQNHRPIATRWSVNFSTTHPNDTTSPPYAGASSSSPEPLCIIFARKECTSSCAPPKIPKPLAPNCAIRVERLFSDATLVKIELVTGLQNQIRAQFPPSAIPSSETGNSIPPNPPKPSSTALRSTPPISNSLILARKKWSRSSANSPPISTT